jgi:hypothetical protein
MAFAPCALEGCEKPSVPLVPRQVRCRRQTLGEGTVMRV